MRLLFVGAPAVGKGTQAKKLAAALGVPHISTGDILRDTAKQNTDLGHKVKKFIDLGSLVPDEVMMNIIEERFRKGDTKNGYILDGFPRTTAQAMGLDMLLARLGQPIDQVLREQFLGLQAVVRLQVDDDEIVAGVSGRWSCPKCGATYHCGAQQAATDGPASATSAAPP